MNHDKESDLHGDPENVFAETLLDSQETNADTFPQMRADALMLLAEQSFLHNGDDLAPLAPH